MVKKSISLMEDAFLAPGGVRQVAQRYTICFDIVKYR